MNLLQYEPWNILSELNTLLEPNAKRLKAGEANTDSRWAPAVDIREEAKQFIVTADLPGVDSDQIEISTENNVLTIRGTREITREKETDAWHRVERVRGEFYRRFALPDTADCEHIKAKSKQGVLEIIIPKHSSTQPRKVKVESAD